MPQHKTHLLVGFIAYGALLYAVLFFGGLRWERMLELLIYTLIGSLFPDIDTKSKIQRLMYCLFLMLMILLAYTKQYMVANYVGIATCIPIIVHHRSLFHSLYFLFFLSSAAGIATYLYYPAYSSAMAYNALFFLTGACSHLVADRVIK